MRRRSNPRDWIGHLEPGKKYTASSTAITGIRDTSRELRADHKPVGLWYACGPAWIDWLERDIPEWLEEVRFVYEVFPNVQRIIELNTLAEIREFDERFGQPDRYSRERRTWHIRWSDVGKLADGIEICPYQRSLRFSALDWYGFWDVASGCIWRPGGLEGIRLIAQR